MNLINIRYFVIYIIQIVMFCTLPFFAQAQEIGILTGTVTNHQKMLLDGVTIHVLALDTLVTTNRQGQYKLTLPVGKYTLKAMSWGYAPLYLTVHIYKDDAITTDFSLKEVSLDGSSLVVIGTRNAARIQLHSPVPVDVIPVEEILQENPQTDLNQFLMYLIPSFQANRQTISDGTDHITPSSLRGFNPDQVLILVNGKRRHTSSLVNVNGTVGRGSVGTDLSAIPLTSVKHIEVLRDGASAQYGSDAIAGVINIVLKDHTDGINVQYTRGTHLEKDGNLRQGSVTYGTKIGKKSFLNVTGSVLLRGYTNRMDTYSGNIFSATGDGDEDSLLNKGLNRSDFNMRVGNAAIQDRSFFFNSGCKLTEATKFYTFGGVSYRQGESAGFYRLPYKSQTVREIYPNGFLPEIHSHIFDQALTTGLRGKTNQWNIDLSNTFGRNSFNFQIKNTNNASLGTASPTSFEAGGFSFMQNTSNLDFNRLFPKPLAGLNVAFGFELRLENYQIHAGEEASYRNYGLQDIFVIDTLFNVNGEDSIYYQVAAGQVDVLGRPGGSQVFPGFRPSNEVNKYRTSFAAYTDVEMDFTPQFMVSGALRLERYSDFGLTLNGKLAARYKLEKDYAIRGTLSTGFRAPSLHQRFFNNTSTQFIDGIPFDVGTFTNESRAAMLVGIPSLQEETSFNYSLGLLARPINGLDITVDGYIIDIQNRIVLTGRFGGQNDQHVAEILEQANATTAAFFSNAVDTKTIGLDIMVSANQELGLGILKTALRANLSKTKIVGAIKTSDLLEDHVETYFNREDRARLELSHPNKASLTCTYNIGRTSFMLRNVYFGAITYHHPTDSLSTNWVVNEFTDRLETRDQRFRGKIITDVSATYQITPKVKATIGANNLFNIYPDKHTHSANNDNGRFPYSRRITQFGFNGAYYFGRISANF